MAGDLVRRDVAVLVSAGGIVSALAAKAATSTIPIVFRSGEDPVANRLVASLNRPGGNATGVYLLIGGLDPKKLGLLRDLLPQATLIAGLFNATRPEARQRAESLQEAARAIGRRTQIVNAS